VFDGNDEMEIERLALWRQIMDPIYWEKQALRRDCGLHCINTLL